MQHCVFTTVRKANRVLFRLYQDALSSTGISIVQLSILRALERHGPLPLVRLADDLVMERTSLYRTIDPLVEANMIIVSKAEIGRTKIAKLTSKGEKTIERVMPYWAIAQEYILSELGDADWLTLHKMLNAIANLETKGESI
ncbi:MarR family winged helix-turn-helix transcriptional regulator [Vibrio harveyi]|uniref:MarR family winged helix-turn-helix transcriptional regulator n=1 Tax=Vibrio harveyi TaxID=669 RepID=UPI003AACC05D